MRLIGRRKRLPKKKILLALLLILLIIIALGFTFQKQVRQSFNEFLDNNYSTVLDWAVEHGYVVTRNSLELYKSRTSIVKDILLASIQAPFRWLSSDSDSLPSLNFVIELKQYLKIKQKRHEALKLSILHSSENDFVPAFVDVNNQQIVRVRMRLKGDVAVDHLAGRKWSFRIKTRDDDSIFSMQRFSMQSPTTRDLIGPLVFKSSLHAIDNNIIFPRYKYVRVTINGENIGIMLLEEHFSKTLLEHRGVLDSPIIKFNESRLWNNILMGDARNPIYNNYKITPISAFRANRLLAKPMLRRDYRVAVGLMRAYIENQLPAHEVFDAKQVGYYLATIDLWGAKHAMQWNNVRFYYNPIIAKLQPIPYDVELDSTVPVSAIASTSESNYFNYFYTELLTDPVVKFYYEQAIKKYAKLIQSGELQKIITQVENDNLKKLGSEFYLYPRFNLDLFKLQIPCLLDRDKCKFKKIKYDASPKIYAPSAKQAISSKLINAYLIQEGDKAYLEIQNIVPFDVKVLGIFSKDNLGNVKEISLKEKLPLTLLSTPFFTLPKMYKITLNALPTDFKDLEIKSQAEVPEDVQNYFGKGKVLTSKIVPYVSTLTQNPIPNVDIKSMLAQNTFIKKEDNQLIIRAGNWQVKGNLIIPNNNTLLIMPGVTLHFSEKNMLVAYGNLIFKGNATQPILLSGKGTQSWNGLVVLQSTKSSDWQYVNVENTSGIKTPLWQLRGGVTFYFNPVTLSHCQFANNSGEDALNIIHSTFKIDHIEIKNAASDGFDSDFSIGEINNSTFHHIGAIGGGDALDFSGSQVTIHKLKIYHIRDKGISIGENSHVDINQADIKNVGVGIVSKDDSSVVLSNVVITDAEYYSLMAFIKKSTYGPATITGTNVKFDQQQAIVQLKSNITINGKTIPPEFLDVDNLYHSIMISNKPI